MSQKVNLTAGMLCWREWRERRIYLLVGCAWMLLFTSYSIAYIASTGFAAPVASFSTTALVYGFLAAMFLAMRTAAGEATDRTRGFSDGLPISPATRGWIRLIGGWLVIVSPIVLGTLLYTPVLASGWLEQAGPRAVGELYVRLPQRESLPAGVAVQMLWTVTAIATASSATYYLLLSIVGTRFRAESHLGYVGAAGLILWFILSGRSTDLSSNEPTFWTYAAGAIAPQALMINFSYSDEAGQYGDLVLAPRLLVPLLLNLGVQTLLAMFFVWRYKRAGLVRRGIGVRRLVLPQLGWLQPPLPTRSLALTWLTLRQALPLCLPGLVIAAAITVTEMLQSNGQYPERFADRLSQSTWFVGTIWAVIVGAGAFAPEIDARLSEFWRVLPIPFGRWFTMKFAVALAAVLLVLDGTPVALAWNSPNWGDYNSMNWSYIMCLVPLHAVLFAMAVAATCWLRRPVLGGFVAILIFGLVTILLEWSPMTRDWDAIEVHNDLAHGDHLVGYDPAWNQLRYLVLATSMTVIFTLSYFAAWRGLARYDTHRLAD